MAILSDVSSFGDVAKESLSFFIISQPAWQGSLLKKWYYHWPFPVNFEKFCEATILKEPMSTTASTKCYSVRY